MNDCRKAIGLDAALGIRIAGGVLRLVILDSHTRWKGHDFFTKTTELEHVGGWRLEDNVAPRAEERLVVDDDVYVRGGRAKKVETLASPRVV